MPEMAWNSTTTPKEGAIVYVLAADDIGQYVIPFPVLFRDDSWWNAQTGEELDAFIAGWRPRDDDARRRDWRGIAAAWSGKGDANRDVGVVRGGGKPYDSTAAVGSGAFGRHRTRLWAHNSRLKS